MANPRYYVTAPVYDPAAPRIQYLYSAILCDAMARHRRNCGYDAAFCATAQATDTTSSSAAEDAAARPHPPIPPGHANLTALARLAGIHYTHTGSFASADHVRAVHSLLRRTFRRSHLAIYKANFRGRYCARDEIDVAPSPAPVQCPRCGRDAELIAEERHFFRLSAFRDRLLALYRYRPAIALPSARMQEVTAVAHHGLQDIPISRTSANGIPWPGDPAYTVCDSYALPALYLSAIGFAGGEGFASEEFSRFWPANWHVVGREQLHSHAIHWPAFLMAADLPLPRHVFAHGTVSLTDDATGSPAPEQMLQTLGSDAFRYAVLREVAYGADARLNFGHLVARNNADLSGRLGSLLRRIYTLIARYCDGTIPRRSLRSGLAWTLEIASKEILAEARFLFDNVNFSEGLEKIWSLLALIDKALPDIHPDEWSAAPARRQELTDWLYDACESLGLAALLLYPIMPRAIAALWKSLGQTTLPEEQLFDLTPWGFLRPGTPVADPGDLFPAIPPAPDR